MSDPTQPDPPSVELVGVLIEQRNLNAQLHAEALARALIAEKRLALQAAAITELRTEFEALKARVAPDVAVAKTLPPAA